MCRKELKKLIQDKMRDNLNDDDNDPSLISKKFWSHVKATSNISELKNSDYIFIALPTQNVREVMHLYGKCNSDQNVIIGSKGIEIDSQLLLYDVISPIINSKIFIH